MFVQRCSIFIDQLRECRKGFDLILTSIDAPALDISKFSKDIPTLIAFNSKFYIYSQNKLTSLNKNIVNETLDETFLIFPKVGDRSHLLYNKKYSKLYENIVDTGAATPNSMSTFDYQLLSKLEQKDSLTVYSSPTAWLSEFDQRFISTVDSRHDVTVARLGCNEIWVKFAFELSRVVDRTYIQILMPSAKNTRDPLLLTFLTDIPGCHYVPTMPKQTKIKNSQYVYIADEGIFYYITPDNYLEEIEIDVAVKTQLVNNFLSIIRTKSNNYISGLQFFELIKSYEGCYLYFDLRPYYLNNNNSVLHRWAGKDNRLCKDFLLSTTDHLASTQLRALSLQELWRVRDKVGEDGMWNEILLNHLPTFKERGHFSHLASPLVDLLTNYFAEVEKNQSTPFLDSFRGQLFTWTEHLLLCRVSDVNCLYGQVFILENKPIYLLEILLDCLQDYEPILTQKLLLVAEWLCNYDVSLLCKGKLLHEMHSSLAVGSYFDIYQLRNILSAGILNENTSPDIQNQIRTLSLSLRRKESIDVTVIDSLACIYKQRELEIVCTPLYYKSKLDVSNIAWIRLAQMLSSAGYLPTNYFSFLMPSMQPLSLARLSKIRSRVGILYYRVLDTTYENFSYCLGRPTSPMKQAVAEIPCQIMPDLLALVETFFHYKQGLSPLLLLQEKFDNFITFLQQCSFDDVGFFYMQSIFRDKHRIYMADILLDLYDALKQLQKTEPRLLESGIPGAVTLSNDLGSNVSPEMMTDIKFDDQPHTLKIKSDKLFQQMLVLVSWLAHSDASLIVSSSVTKAMIPESDMLDDTAIAVNKVYQELGVGPAFDVRNLKEILKQLILVSESFIHSKINTLQKKLDNSACIDKTVMSLLRELFADYWDKTKTKTKYCHLTQELGMNSPWVRLAQLLSGAGFLKAFEPDSISSQAKALRECYYVLLMPTLIYCEDRIRKVPITDYYLSHYVLQANGQQLILLDNSVGQFEAERAFYDCNTKEIPTRFSDAVLQQVKYANKKFRQYSILARSVEEDQPITIFSYLIVKNFIDQALFPIGLEGGKEYNQSQKSIATEAYNKFCSLYKELPDGEQQKLNRQRIIVNGQNLRLDYVLDIGWECIAVMCFRLVHMCKSYINDDYTKFKPEIENKIKDKPTITKFFAGKELTIYRVKCLLVELLTVNFQDFSEATRKISIAGCSNSLVPVANSIFNQLAPMVLQDQYDNLFKTYIKMIELIVKSELRSANNLSQAKKVRWLESIVDSTIFSQSRLYEPVALVTVLSTMTFNNHDNHTKVTVFLDELLCICMKNQTINLTDLKLNIMFRHLLSSLNQPARDAILTAMNQSSRLYDNRDFNRVCAEHWVNRFKALGFKVNALAQQTFFDSTQVISESMAVKIREAASLRAVFSLVRQIAQLNSDSSTHNPVINYINSIEARLSTNDEQEYTPIACKA